MNYFLTTFALLIALKSVAQLSVGNQGMTILSATTLAVDGLTLTPTSTLTMANNSVQKSTTPVAGSPSINRLYRFDSPLLFSGTAGVNYLTEELNGFTESNLQLAYAPTANTTLTFTTGSTVNTTTHYVSNSLANKNLFVVSAGTLLSDLTPILYARPTTISGTSDVSVVVDVVEINSVATSGLFTVRITKDSRVSLTFPEEATSVNNRSVQNNAWQLNAPDANYYVLSTRYSVPAGDKLSFGLVGKLNPGATSGVLGISSIILPTTVREAKLTNNADADKIDYFQQ
ncbi:hypothetical protein [Spirosoma validum]|uniref:DUF4397 domain-containing protein n=1 Tax=Spirosoma validum TaxID=2771355 RepID=A0A927GGD4_9BACT|nr:hypothetical protein [Spirosoma validum]MBD2756593.1 hypothetical protein [Spirosoma validum]